MKLKARLHDYTQAEFTNLVLAIWDSDITKNELDTLIHHFNEIVEDPSGTDLIFYPPFVEYAWADDANNVVHWLNIWLQKNGKPGFKDEPAFPVFTNQPTNESRSAAALAHAEQMESRMPLADQTVEQALQSFDQPLGNIEALLQVSGLPVSAQPTKQQLAGLIENISLLQAAKPPLRLAVALFNAAVGSLDSTIEQAKRGLENTQSSIDRAVNETIVQTLTHARNRYQARSSVVQKHMERLQTRATAALSWAQEQRTRLGALLDHGPKDIPHTFVAPTMAINHPFVLTALSADQFQSSLLDLQFMSRSAIARFFWEAETSTDEVTGQYIDLLRFSTRLGGDEHYGFTLPLSEVMPLNGHDWPLVAKHGEVKLPFRLNSGVIFVEKDSCDYQHIYLTPTNGTTSPSAVRVRAAIYDPEQRTYRFTSDDLAPTSIIWSPGSKLANLTPRNAGPSPNSGSVRPELVPTLKPLPADVQFDDYVVVFPENSRIEPVYLMLKDRRDYPGVGSGQGQAISGPWLPGDSPTLGAPVPSQIAAQLRGQVFKRFSALKEALWMAVAADPVLSAQCSAEDLAIMRTGQAPSITHDGIRKPYQMHHVTPAAQGGKIYDLDNMRIIYRT
jgi:hypothetical protein